jgi:GMP synthase (glutamine-hydrolysing)
VVLLPLTRSGGETIALRPVTSVDGMTAEVAQLSAARMAELTRQLMSLDGVDAVLYDLSNKPPATIEWE